MRKALLTVSTLFLTLFACDGDPSDSPDADMENRYLTVFDPPPLEDVVSFNPAALEAPESIVTDFEGNLFVSLALTGEIRKIAPDGTQSTFAMLPIGQPLVPCGGLVGILGALARDWDDNIYASVASCNEEDRGVWKIAPDGEKTLLGNLPFSALPNGIARFGGNLYIADSSGAIWTLPMEGGEPEIWADGPLLAQSGLIVDGIPVPGPNGIQFFGNEAYVANSSQATIVRIKLLSDGSAGEPEVYHTTENGQGCDDFAFDLIGGIYCTTDPFQTVTYISRIFRKETVLWTAEDGLDGPTASVFGRGADRKTLYIANANFPFFPSTGNGPSVQKVELPIGGYPFR